MSLRDLSVTGAGWRRDWEALRGRVEGEPARDANAKMIVDGTRLCFLAAAITIVLLATIVVLVLR
jgi:hypothetical protein